MEDATEESSGTGEAMSRYDAGSETIERQVLNCMVEDKISLPRRWRKTWQES